MFAFFITIHVLTCSLLILLVLVQQGRGGGLIDSFSSAESIFGTKTNTFLVKATSILAVVFFVSCLALAFLSIQKNKSLIETSYKPSTSQAKDAKENISGESAKTEGQKTDAETTEKVKKDMPEKIKSDTQEISNTQTDETKKANQK
ncbi:MAG: preprotein translocase subunit SecG [Candidatus Omnitrophota bacterium]